MAVVVSDRGKGAASPREVLGFEERSRVLREVVPTLKGEGASPCGRVRATVGHECELVRLELDWDKLREQLEHKRDSRNELVGAAELAGLVEFAVVTAVNDLQVRVTDAFHVPAPTRAALAEGYRDEYWSLPEHVRPDDEDEYVRERLAERGGKANPGEQAEADIAASKQRVAEALSGLERDPKKIRASEPGVLLPAGVAEAKEDAARFVERLAEIDTSARFEGKDDEHSPSVIVTATFASPFGLWLHPEVFRRVGGSRLGKIVPVCAARAKEKLVAAIRGG